MRLRNISIREPTHKKRAKVDNFELPNVRKEKLARELTSERDVVLLTRGSHLYSSNLLHFDLAVNL